MEEPVFSVHRAGTQDACVLTLALPPVTWQRRTFHPTSTPHLLSSLKLNGILHV